MRNKFKHLRLEHRLYLAHMLENSANKRDIAQKLGVHRSTIYRELKRNHEPKFGFIF